MEGRRQFNLPDPVNSPVTSFVYTPQTISPAWSGASVERAAYHVAFQDSGLDSPVVDCGPAGTRRTVARDALRPRRRGLGPDRIRPLACRPPRQFHRRSV